MTMLFRIYTAALEDMLGAAQGTDFITVGYAARSKDASEYLNNKRTVEVVYKGGIFPKSSSGRGGAIQHQMSWEIVLTVSKAASADLATLNDSNSTAEQLATAIVSCSLSDHAADESMNEFEEIVFQILMSASNRDLGLNIKVADTFVDSFQKDEPGNIGELTVLRGKFTFSAQGKEEITGDTPVTGVSVDITMDINNDTVQKTGVYVEPSE